MSINPQQTSSSTPTIELITSVESIPGVTEKQATELRLLGLRCVADLLLHMPLRYEDVYEPCTIAQVSQIVEQSGGEAPGILTTTGEIDQVQLRFGRRKRVEVEISDGDGSMVAVWFNTPWIHRRLHPAMRIEVTGRPKYQKETLTIINPRLRILDQDSEDQESPLTAEQETAPEHATQSIMRPVYPASERLKSSAIAEITGSILSCAIERIEDHLPDTFRKQRSMPPLADAYRMVHQPKDQLEVDEGRRRLIYDEFLLLQLGVFLKRHHRQQTLRAINLGRSEAIHEHILARFPFKLTESQNEVIEQLSSDCGQSVPMNRLVQGDVGSGKTVIALYALLLAVANGHQAVLMAPTELLAEQHKSLLKSWLADSKVRVELLTSSLTTRDRNHILNAIESGEVDIVVGTHAVLTDDVAFRSLAVVVTDEQHRFGVHQRASLRSKGADSDLVPHCLVMTATPIPRTLSLTIFGDLDVSTIRGMPPGRQPVQTLAVPPEAASRVYTRVAEHVSQGRQAYVVVPVIDESNTGLKDVASHCAALRDGPLAGRRVEAMHGRLSSIDRDVLMQEFRQGDIDVLVATTVIEVGVDVPNATMMIIEHAERFGLAQLHQLRGRVGRSDQQGHCVLISQATTSEAISRINALVETADGFVIAQRDLDIRGPGELFGAKQSGLAPFRIAQLPADTELLQLARRDAAELVEQDSRLTDPSHRLLKRRLLKAHGSALGLGDVA
ncbi:MAG: ATP-dependent DNA helicase RecG [Phycisphaerales bacterium]|nr:ATP-dependent DNA helicase RecG [Phycisphaerales bacterium]